MQNHHVNQIASERSIMLLLMLSFLYFMSSNHGWRVLCQEALQMTPIGSVHFSVNRRNHHQYHRTKSLIGTTNEQRCELFWESNYMSREKKSKPWSSYNNLLQNLPTKIKCWALCIQQNPCYSRLGAFPRNTSNPFTLFGFVLLYVGTVNSAVYMQSFQFLNVFNSSKLKRKKVLYGYGELLKC